MRRRIFFALLLATVTAAWGAFKQPSEADRLVALGDLTEEPATLRQLLAPAGEFLPAASPQPNDWLALHVERGQSFAEYRAAHPRPADASRRVIYFLPIGDFPEDNSPPLGELRAYAAAFFQMEVKVLPTYIAHDQEFDPRNNRASGHRQIWTQSVMTFLKARLPADACCLLAITMTDLYPQPSWNFVFGQASLEERVGVYSFARYDPEFLGGTRGKDYRDLILQRSCKVLVHETAHMFGLPHCIYYDCVMNGANHLDETDAKPQHLCPVCLRKLHLATGLDAVQRYTDLAQFYRRQKWFAEYDFTQRMLGRVRQP